MPDVTLRLAQPAALGRRPRGTAPIETYRHIPGSVLRGALAAVWIREYGPPQGASPARRAEFVHLFEGPVRYGPLFDPVSAVVPLSVYRCKYRPQRECHSEYADMAAAGGGAADRPRCRRCGGPLVAGKGEVEFFGTAAPVVENTRVALTEEERAADGKLFTRRSLSHLKDGGEPRELSGRITDTSAAGTEWLLAAHALHIGGRRSTAGAAEYSARPDDAAALPDPAELVVDGTLVVRLTAPAILVDAAGRPTDRPDTVLLASLLGTKVTVDRSWIRRERVNGWNALTNLPKAEELAVSAGSVFQLRLASTPSREGLASLRDHGLGLRRSEGFGWVELGHWTLPQVAAAVVRPQQEDLYSGMARLLYETGAGARYLKWLRECALRQRRGEPAGSRFLDLPAAEGLLHNERLRTRLQAVLKRDVQDLERILVHLEARVREGRR
ncbi:type III-B CRISPR module-associated Cmr3 family protein [Streptomyces sp. NPDC002896]|uniref:type III-B CRISPR module-associated Cmr3 family protein n=1 Tax=Streptomyces sp. NPDC002896 TaxID=3154438 RepID=UPI00332909A6